MKQYLYLLRKEARQATGTALVFTLVLGAILAYLVSRARVWPMELVFALIISLSGFIPFWALWRTYYSLRQEWTGDHMYLLLSLPVPGWYITSTKLLIAALEALVYTLLVVGAAFLVLALGDGIFLPRDVLREPAFYAAVLRIGTLFGLVLAMGMVVIQFSYLCGRLVSRFRGLMSLLMAFVSLWLLVRGGTWLEPLLRWVPDWPLYNINIVDGAVEVTTNYIGLAPLLGSAVTAFVLFITGSLLLERDLEL